MPGDGVGLISISHRMADDPLDSTEVKELLTMLDAADEHLGGFMGPVTTYRKVEQLRVNIRAALQKYQWFMEQ